jgi:hypothetical protein
MTDSNELVGEKTSVIQPDQNRIYDFQWPLQWLFGSHKEKLDAIDLNGDNDFDEQMKKLNWRNLHYMRGWESSYWTEIERNIPADPGIYVIAHEVEKPALYVGQSKNLRKRLLKPHHKIEKIIEIYSCCEDDDESQNDKKNLKQRKLISKKNSASSKKNKNSMKAAISRRLEFPFLHDPSRAKDDILVFWKIAEKPYYNDSLSKTLVWYEALAIGLLCPIMQGDLKDIEKTIWAVGMQEFE